MTNNKNNLTKGGWLILLCCLIILLSPKPSQAIILTNPDVNWKVPIVYLDIFGNEAYYYTDYEITALEFDYNYIEAFCVENIGINADAGYELIDVPSSASDEDLMNAALIADQFFNGGVGWSKTATQLAIWEVVFDSISIGGSFDLNSGNFKYTGSTYDVAEILNGFISDTYKSTGGVVMLAHSPAVVDGGEIGEDEISQDYLVGRSVPDASIMWLLGPAFIGLGLLGRKKSQEQNSKLRTLGAS